MNKTIFIIVCILCYSSANCQVRQSEDLIKKFNDEPEKLNILIDTRFDLQGAIQNKKVNDRTFYADLLKVAFTGSITPKIHYLFRQRLNKPQNPNTRDGLSDATDFAWISFDVDDNWNIKAGKQSINFGTFEYNYNLADVFLPTMIYSDLVSNEIGVNVAYKTKNQVLNLQVLNSPDPQFASQIYENKALASTFLWEGSLWKGIYKTRWGTGLFQHTKHRYYNWITIGNQINIDKFIIEADYYEGYRNMNYGSVVDDDNLGLRYVHDQAVSLKFMYNLEKWRPFIKSIWSNRFDKVFNKEAYKIYGIEAVAEYYPFTDPKTKNLRFHAAYMFSSTQVNKGLVQVSDTNEHRFLVGVRWLFKVK